MISILVLGAIKVLVDVMTDPDSKLLLPNHLFLLKSGIPNQVPALMDIFLSRVKRNGRVISTKYRQDLIRAFNVFHHGVEVEVSSTPECFNDIKISLQEFIAFRNSWGEYIPVPRKRPVSLQSLSFKHVLVPVHERPSTSVPQASSSTSIPTEKAIDQSKDAQKKRPEAKSKRARDKTVTRKANLTVPGSKEVVKRVQSSATKAKRALWKENQDATFRVGRLRDNLLRTFGDQGDNRLPSL